MPGRTLNIQQVVTELNAVLAASLAGARDSAALVQAVTASAAAAESVCSGTPVACAAGCPHCCVLNVAALLPEVMIISDWLRERLVTFELDMLRNRLALYRSQARWMEDEERITSQVACPFLDKAGRCSIHPVRPLVCRSVASFDRDSCREVFNPRITDEPRLVPADLLRQEAYDAAFTTLADALRCNGFDDRSIELGAGVLAFLEDPECRQRLLAGERLPGTLWQQG